MKTGPSFSEILTAADKGWSIRKADECLLSLALPLKSIDPLYYLPLIAEGHKFRFLWDGSPGFCFAASGQCQHVDLAGPRRFELAQRFTDATLGRLEDVSPEFSRPALPRILFSFSFFEQTSERLQPLGDSPAVQAVLPRWQLIRQGDHGWLRLNGVATHQAEARELAEQIWLMRKKLVDSSENESPLASNILSGIAVSQPWQECYRPALIRGIELVNEGILEKLVLAVRQSIWLRKPLDPLAILSRLRHQQPDTCRFLWQRSYKESFFGASPERLLSIQDGFLRSDALAGTASKEDDGEELLKSEKDRREHELVVASIVNQLLGKGISPKMPKRPRLARYGQLVHLHTPISGLTKGQTPLSLADALHPTPAVAGLPRREAMSWLRTLEPFERGSYAAPIGWIDSKGNAEFRVAIRCGNAVGNRLELTAGAGLVRGSVAERELQEVGLKLSVLADQLELKPNCDSSDLADSLLFDPPTEHP